jgi:glutathione peroxidase
MDGFCRDGKIARLLRTSHASGLQNARLAASLHRMKTLPLLAAALLFSTMNIHAAGSIYDVPLKTIDGADTTLKPYAGKVLLIVNVASKCGFTKQYDALEAVYKKYKDQGLVILGFPCNQFGGQEPGTGEEIKQFCTAKFGVTFPLFGKIEVNGAGRHALYAILEGSDPSWDIKWNFTKFLISRDGKILKRFDSKITPDSPEAIAAIEAALAAK